MRIYRTRSNVSVDPSEFPPYFAVCISAYPNPQFQVLSLQPIGHLQDEIYILENENPQVYRDVYFENRQRNPEDYLVGTISVQKPNSTVVRRVRFEIRQMFLMNSSLQLPIVLLDDITMMPRPEVLIVPVNLEPSDQEINNPYAIMNHLLDPHRIRERFEMEPRRNRWSSRWFRDNSDDDMDIDPPGPARGGAGSMTPSRGQPRQLTPPPAPRRPRPSIAQVAPAPAPAPAPVVPPRSLQSFTINALISHAVAEAMNCPIMMVPIEKNTSAVLNCQHIFNRQAITRWLADGNTTCPVCREVCHICN